MCVYALNISELVENHRVTWLERGETSARQPEHLVLYTLVKGEGAWQCFVGCGNSQKRRIMHDIAESGNRALYLIFFG